VNVKLVCALLGLVVVLLGSRAGAQPVGCEVVVPTPFRLLESQSLASGGIPFPARTRVRAIAYGTVRQNGMRPVRVRIDTAEGWIYFNAALYRGCAPGSIAERPGDVAPTSPPAPPAPQPAPAAPPPAPTPPPQPARVCIPGSTQACLCVGGTSGVQSCASSGMAYEACVCAAPALPPPAPAPPPATPAPPPPQESSVCAGEGEMCRPGERECCDSSLRCVLLSRPYGPPRRWLWGCRPCGRLGQPCCRGSGTTACSPGSCSPGLTFDPESEVCRTSTPVAPPAPVGRGGCNTYGCWRTPGGSCNSYGCTEWGVCNSYGCPRGPGGGCNSYGCWSGGGGCNSYGCWTNNGGCNSYGCWNSPGGSCTYRGCSG
jgi:hypothetical protein